MVSRTILERRSGRNQLWARRFLGFRRSGFSVRESEWAADQKLKLGDELVREVMGFRRRFVDDFVKTFPRATRALAIAQAERQLRTRNMRFGLTGLDVHNIFREISI